MPKSTSAEGNPHSRAGKFPIAGGKPNRRANGSNPARKTADKTSQEKFDASGEPDKINLLGDRGRLNIILKWIWDVNPVQAAETDNEAKEEQGNENGESGDDGGGVEKQQHKTLVTRL